VKAQAKEVSLYFLPDDPGEEKDLSGEKPEKVKEMVGRLEVLIGEATAR